MKLVYFAWLRERLDRSDEDVELPEETETIENLIAWLAQRDEQFSDVFEHAEIIQVAVDQKVVHDRSTLIGEAKEIAFFPPMTGG